MKVSIITITQLIRHESFKLLIDYIQNQTYKNIIEWIIIDGSPTIDDSNTNFNLIKNLNITYPKIIYKGHINNNEINKKNIITNLNNDINGDIIIYMDDDDYYFPSFIEYIVSKMINSNKNIASSQFLYVHDIILNKTFKINYDISPFIYRKNCDINDEIEYLLSEYLVIKLVHNNNNFFNKTLICTSSIYNNDKVHKLEDEIINFLIPDKYYMKYKELYITNNNFDYDIVYFIGGFSIIWSPTDTNLSGSEQAIVKLSENWVKEGKKVIVYGNFTNLININGVDYDNWLKFPYEKKINKLILWRKSGILSIISNDYKADNTIIDLHDNMFVFNDIKKEVLINFFNKIDYINLKSEYHKESFINYFGNEFENKINIIPNGINVEQFSINNENVIRQPYRFCFCSSYDRSLADILRYIWPHIYKAENRAELHIYYGMDYIYDDNFKNTMQFIIGSTQGVMEHGRQDINTIIREKYMSTFHLYICNAESETDCINVKESLVAGCIPIISDFGVFKERHGLQYPINKIELTEEIYKNIALDIINKMKNSEFIENCRNTLKTSNTIISWSTVANIWLQK
jgi:hypothetical protein